MSASAIQAQTIPAQSPRGNPPESFRRKPYETLFPSLAHARAMLEAWRRDYNEKRPHSKLDWMTPRAYASAIRETDGRSAAQSESSALPPLATAIDDGSDHDRTLVSAG